MKAAVLRCEDKHCVVGEKETCGLARQECWKPCSASASAFPAVYAAWMLPHRKHFH